MKVYINREPIHGPWGGGAKTVNKLALTLEEKGHEVVYKLQPGIEKIFCFDPRPNEYGEGISHLFEYKTKHSTKIIQRIGDIGTHAENLAEYISGLQIKELAADITTFVKGRKLDDDGNVLFSMEANVISTESRGYDGCRGWVGDFSVNDVEISLGDVVTTALDAGLEHHFGLVAGKHTTAVKEWAYWVGARCVAPIPYSNGQSGLRQ